MGNSIIRNRSARLIAIELKQQIRIRSPENGRAITWSVPVGAAPDSELDKALEILARLGVRGSYERELGFIAHFDITW